MTQSPYKICPRCGQEVAHAVQKCGRCGLDFNVPFLLNEPPIEEPIRTILTPRERQRIFEEEEARAEARRQIAERERIYEEEKERRATEDHYAVAIGPDVPSGPQGHLLKEKGPVPPIPSVALVALLGFCLWAISKGFQGEPAETHRTVSSSIAPPSPTIIHDVTEAARAAIQSSVAPQAAPQDDADRARVVATDVVWRREGYGYDAVRGRIVNNSHRHVQYWEAVAYFFNTNGDRIDSQMTNDIQPLAPGSARRFEIMHKTDPKARRMDVEVESIRFKD